VDQANYWCGGCARACGCFGAADHDYNNNHNYAGAHLVVKRQLLSQLALALATLGSFGRRSVATFIYASGRKRSPGKEALSMKQFLPVVVGSDAQIGLPRRHCL
jgi:hypothetical protein